MATLVQLKQSVTNLIAASSSSQTQMGVQFNSNTRERVFEAYCFLLILDAVRSAGGTAVITGINSGANPTTIVFRGGPGFLGSTAQDFAYANCFLNGKQFEVHLDVEYQGSSGAVHELDISVVDEAHAETIRKHPAMLPTTRHVRAAVECKFYDSSLGVALGRVFVGLVSDCGQMRIAGFMTNGNNHGLAKFLTAKSNIETFFDTTPLVPLTAVRLQGVFEQALRKWAAIP